MIYEQNPETAYDDSITEVVYDHHILYWRKWWSFRNDVMAQCGFADGDCEFALDLPNLKTIADIHHYYNNEEVWEDSVSIWNWEEVKETFQQQEKVFQWLLEFKKLHPEIEIFFYDSY